MGKKKFDSKKMMTSVVDRIRNPDYRLNLYGNLIFTVNDFDKTITIQDSTYSATKGDTKE